ncbi:hypothetical protein DPMN_052611 [Dreissena polymorpha]|uniref:Uncharacterized protein n=1 Tax=Dreissena polymorpha TaxID=45954 RepID=A0A9D4CLL0_DREPO|nr:hypothetical protein DPMN_052611 [Dreissena polymorpha]
MLFKATVKSVILYGAEAWRTTVTCMKKSHAFITTCLRKIRRPSSAGTCMQMQSRWVRRGESWRDSPGRLEEAVRRHLSQI